MSETPPSTRRFQPVPIEETSKKVRRFAPEPVETTTRSSKMANDVSRSAGGTPAGNDAVERTDFAGRKRFLPTLVETTFKSSKLSGNALPTPETTPVSIPASPSPAPAEETPRPRPRPRFAPQLIETSKRSKKAGDKTPATLPTDKVRIGSVGSNICGGFQLFKQFEQFSFVPQWSKVLEHSSSNTMLGRSNSLNDSKTTFPVPIPCSPHSDIEANFLLWQTDLTPGVPNIYTRSKRRVVRPPANTPHQNSISLQSTIIAPRAPARQGSMRPHPNTRRSTRQNSFQPELDAIPSSGSDEDEQHSDGESTPSLTGSFGSSDDSLMRLRLSRTRESCDDRFSGYLLALAAKAAEKQLREQALAAFPNESRHEIVEHFYDREIDPASDEESVEGIGMLLDADIPTAIRRKSTEVGWMAKEMQAHQEKLNRMREEETNAKIAAEATKPTFQDPFWTNGMTSKSPFITHNYKNENADPKDAELRCMRSAASPPMLGGDLKFRMCPSPKATKFETDQKIDVQPNKSENGGGLWGGYCVADEVGEYLSPSIKGPALIQTPHPEREDPFSAAFSSELPGSGTKTPRNRDSGLRMLAGIDERLKAEVAKSKAEEAMLEEFDDTFVTQVYNYLSLGYPSLARQFDEELARISRISEDELRVDDMKKNAKGYIGIVDGFSSRETTPEKKRVNDDTKHEGYCARWKALRIYILEWARQHPSMSNGAMGPSAWGVRARRGSWAI